MFIRVPMRSMLVTYRMLEGECSVLFAEGSRAGPRQQHTVGIVWVFIEVSVLPDPAETHRGLH